MCVAVVLIFMLLVPSRMTFILFFFFNDPATTEIYPLSLHDALPIFGRPPSGYAFRSSRKRRSTRSVSDTQPQCSSVNRSEEHTSELQSQSNLVCRLLLEKKKKVTCRPDRPRSPVHRHEPHSTSCTSR